jgi:hypothetical protein
MWHEMNKTDSVMSQKTVAITFLKLTTVLNLFNIPTHAPIIYTLQITKFTLKHLKFAPTCFGPFLRPSSGGSWTVLYAVTKLRLVDARPL